MQFEFLGIAQWEQMAAITAYQMSGPGRHCSFQNLIVIGVIYDYLKLPCD